MASNSSTIKPKQVRRRLPNELINEMVQFIPAGVCMTEGVLKKMSPIRAFVYPHFKKFIDLKALSLKNWALRSKMMELKRIIYKKDLLEIKIGLKEVSEETPIDPDKVDDLSRRVAKLEKQKDELEKEAKEFDTEWSTFCGAWDRTKQFADELLKKDINKVRETVSETSVPKSGTKRKNNEPEGDEDGDDSKKDAKIAKMT